MGGCGRHGSCYSARAGRGCRVGEERERGSCRSEPSPVMGEGRRRDARARGGARMVPPKAEQAARCLPRCRSRSGHDESARKRGDVDRGVTASGGARHARVNDDRMGMAGAFWAVEMRGPEIQARRGGGDGGSRRCRFPPLERPPEDSLPLWARRRVGGPGRDPRDRGEPEGMGGGPEGSEGGVAGGKPLRARIGGPDWNDRRGAPATIRWSPYGRSPRAPDRVAEWAARARFGPPPTEMIL